MLCSIYSKTLVVDRSCAYESSGKKKVIKKKVEMNE